MKQKRIKPVYQQHIALERIRTLFREAKTMFHEDSKLSDRYVFLARKIAMKYKVKIPSLYRKKFCKNCHSYLVPSVNCSVRTKKGHLVYTCKACRNIMRFPFKG